VAPQREEDAMADTIVFPGQVEWSGAVWDQVSPVQRDPFWPEEARDLALAA
jgi:hypothetical protein